MRIERKFGTSKGISFEREISDIIVDATANIFDSSEPEIEKQVESWLESISFSGMIEKISEVTALHVEHAIDGAQQSIVDSVLD